MDKRYQYFLRSIVAVVLLGSLGFRVATVFAATEAFYYINDAMSRQAVSTKSKHTFTFFLPAVANGQTDRNFDATGGTDVLSFSFPTSSGFSATGTWTTADFSFNDGTARTINAVAQGSGVATVSCTDGANNVGVAIDTDGPIVFRVIPCGGSYTASADGASILFIVKGDDGSNGELTNPSGTGSQSIILGMTDEGVAGAVASTIGVPITSSDLVSVSASVDPSITFDINTPSGGAACSSTVSNTVSFGAITVSGESGVKTSGATDGVERVCLDASTNAANGMEISVKSANAALKSASTPADYISSNSAAMVAGTENYGLCVGVAASGLTASGTFYAGAGTCDLNANDNTVGAVTTGTQTMLSSSGPITSGTSELYFSAAISGTTKAHSDYQDTLTIIASGTF